MGPVPRPYRPLVTLIVFLSQLGPSLSSAEDILGAKPCGQFKVQQWCSCCPFAPSRHASLLGPQHH